ncbi:hypothetical protein [Actinoplanes sp. NPDC020271]|uniref:hypothetical protein n=1 Tax=Actinoplanes sp. NPDC020271 TaxID=3363896 RepID=UPI0037A2AC69
MWRIVRLVLVALWLVAASAAWWGAPREAGTGEAFADVREHRVVAYQLGTEWQDDSPDRWFAVPTLETGDQDRIFAWRTSDGRTHWADISDTPDLKLELSPDRSANVLYLSTLINGIGLLFTLVFVGVLWVGPTPVTGTRWYWWWLFALVPFGLGLLYWTFHEVPWTRPDIPESRDTGWRGLGTAIVVSVLVSVILYGLTSLFGEAAFPDLLTP